MSRIARRARRDARRLTQALRDHGVLPGIDPPVDAVASIHEPLPGVRLHELGTEPQTTATAALTLGEPASVFTPERRRPAGPLWVLEVDDGRLGTAAGLAFAPDGRAFAETTWDLEQLRLALPHGRRLPPPFRARGTQASLITAWSDNYYHWLLDALPRLAVLERAGAADANVVVPEHLTRFQEESLSLLGVSRQRRTPYRRGHLQASTLLVPSPAAHTGNPVRWQVEWLRARLSVRAPAARGRRLFVSRADTRFRKLADEEAAWGVAAARGFQRVTPGTLDLAEQIALFADASVVLGPHGAAHANTLFARDSTLIELFPADYLNRCNFALCEAAGNDYWYIIGSSQRDGEFTVPLDLLEATLDAAVE